LAMEETAWNIFLEKEVVVIINDPPSDIPKRKEGILKSVTETHAILLMSNGSSEAILLTLIRRMESPKKQQSEGWR
jgi:hypothetical protein